MTTWKPLSDMWLEIEAAANPPIRTSATAFTVYITATWKTFYDSNKTLWGVKASSGGKSVVLNPFGTKSGGSTKSFTGTYSISGNGSAKKTISITFEFYNSDTGKSYSKTLYADVTVPALISYTVSYNANGGSGAPGKQTKWKDQTLVLSSTKPTRSGYVFSSWNTASNGTGTKYNPGGNYTTNASATLYAQWAANGYTVSYDANGGTGAPSQQTKTHGVALTLSSTKPTRTNYTFKGWGTSKSATTVSYQAGGSYTNNATITLYAIWELSHKKPRISNVSLSRVTRIGTNSDGTGIYEVSDDGSLIRIDMTWSCDGTEPELIFYYKLSTAADVDANWQDAVPKNSIGTSGTNYYVLTGSNVDPEESWDIKIELTDSVGTSTYRGILPSKHFVMDFKSGGDGAAFGKTAEIAECLDVAWNTRVRKDISIDGNATIDGYVCIGEKTGFQDGKEGIYLDDQGYMHLERDMDDGKPYIGFYSDKDAGAAASAIIQYNNDSTDGNNGKMEFLNATGYRFDKYTLIGSSKTAYNDGKSGWYLGPDGTAHITAAGSPGIYFHRASSTGTTAYIEEATAGTLTVSSNLKSGNITATGTVSGASASITNGVSATTVTASSYTSTANVRGTGNYGITFGVANKPEIMHIYQTGGSTTGNRWFRPMANDDLYLGTEGQRWKQIWSVNSLNSTSDRNVKFDITTFDERYEKLFASLKPVAYKFINGDSGRFHSGFISQDVEESLKEVGLTALDFAAFCKDKKTKEIADPETGEITFIDICDADGNPEYSYSLRYEEFIALNTHMIQKLQNENSELKAKVESLEERFSKLEELINK